MIQYRGRVSKEWELAHRLAKARFPEWRAVVMHTTSKDPVLGRLRRIEGQVRGISKMVEDDRYCIDVLQQIDAVRAALHKVANEILKDHVRHCVTGAFQDGDAVQQSHKIEELVSAVGRMTR